MTPWAVVFGGPSPEHEISILTGLQAERVLTRADEQVLSLYWAPTGGWHLVPNGTEAKDYLSGPPPGAKPLDLRLGAEPGIYLRGRMRAEQLDVAAALCCLHGGLGEGGAFAGLMALLGIPTTGGSLYAAALGMDKLAFAGLLAAAGIPALPRVALETGVEPPFSGPYIVKPRFGGSSIGIEIVEDLAAARAVARSSVHLRAGAVVEPYRTDLIDLNIAVRSYPALELSDIERPLRSANGGVYSYADKYLTGGGEDAGMASAPRELPAQIPPAVADQIRAYARRVAALLPVSGAPRLDFLCNLEREEVLVNEINTVPGAMGLYLWASRVSAADVLRGMLIEARDAGVPAVPSGFGSGAALRAAGGIAGKLVGLDGPRI